MRLVEALLLALGVATLILLICTAMAVALEGAHYATALRAGGAGAVLALRYAGVFLGLGLLAWTLSRLAPSRRRRRVALVLALLTPLALLLDAVRVLKPPLGELLVRGPALAGLALLAAALAWAVASRRSAPLRLALALLLAGLALLASAGSFAVHPSSTGLVATRGLALLAAAAVAACLAALPLGLALRHADERDAARRLGRALTLYALLFLAGVWATPAARPGVDARADARAGPPVLLIVADTLRADFAPGGDAFGAMPRLQALARDGVTFENAYSTAPWTTPAFASLLTSTYPSEHGAGEIVGRWRLKRSLAEDVVSLAEVLTDAGYWTGAVLSNAFLGPRYGLDRGFHAYENLLALEWYHPALAGLAERRLLRWRPYLDAERQTARVGEMIRRAVASGAPFFVLAHYMDPHTPYAAPARVGAAPADATPRVAAYWQEVAYLDAQLGALLDELREAGVYRDLLIVVTSDHGEELFEERLAAPAGGRVHDHGHTVYEELIRVPLILKLPREEAAGSRVAEAVSLLDVAPTILSHAGVEPPAGFRGRALPPAEPPDASRVIFAERLLYGPERKAAIRSGRKVILVPRASGATAALAYDLARDPGERQPLRALPGDERFGPLLAALRELPTPSPPLPGDSPAGLQPLERRQLEALGYAEPDAPSP